MDFIHSDIHILTSFGLIHFWNSVYFRLISRDEYIVYVRQASFKDNPDASSGNIDLF